MVNIKPPVTRDEIQQHNSNINGTVLSTVLYIDSGRRVAVIKNSRLGSNMVVGIAADFGNDALPPNTGEYEALVDFGSSPPLIVTFVPRNSGGTAAQVEGTVESGGDVKDIFESMFDSTESYRPYEEKKRKLNYRGRKSYDWMPGDWGHFNEIDGNFLVVGRGGVNKLYISSLCQIVQMLTDNLTKIISSNLNIQTDFGVMTFENKDNRVKMALRGSSDHAGKANKGIYDLNLEIGSCADGMMVSLNYKTRKNGEKFTMTIDTMGRLFTNIPNDHTTLVDGKQVLGVTDSKSDVIAKDYNIDVGGNMIVTTTGGGTIKLGGDDLNANNNAVVLKPHLGQYKTLLNKIAGAAKEGVPMDIPGIPFMIRSTGFAALLAEAELQAPICEDAPYHSTEVFAD